MSGRNNEQTKSFLLSGINDFMKNPTFVRSFAYYTTPVYGYPLYHRDQNWNKKINAKTDLTDYFIKSFGIRIPAVLQTTVDNKSILIL